MVNDIPKVFFCKSYYLSKKKVLLLEIWRPLVSLYIFVFVLEALSKIIYALVNGSILSGGIGVVVLSIFLTFCARMTP
jgi:hypothetical protein